jgi:hypothetical protein
MTVNKLREILEQMDGDAVVVIDVGDGGGLFRTPSKVTTTDMRRVDRCYLGYNLVKTDLANCVLLD